MITVAMLEIGRRGTHQTAHSKSDSDEGEAAHLDQRADDLEVAVDGSIVQRRVVIAPGGVHLRPVIDEQLGDLGEPMVASLMQRAPPAD